MQAARGGAHASSRAGTHIEAAAEAAAGLKQCCSHLRLGSPSGIALAARAGGDVQALIQHISLINISSA